MIILTSKVMEAVRGQKISSEGQNSMNEWIFWKKGLIKVVQWPQKPLLWTISRRSFTIFLQKWVKLNVGRWKRHTTEGKTIEALKSSHSFSLQPRYYSNSNDNSHCRSGGRSKYLGGAIVILITFKKVQRILLEQVLLLMFLACHKKSYLKKSQS